MAKEKVSTKWGGQGVAYCMRDCNEFPCQKYYEWQCPYGKDYLEMHKQRSKQQKLNKHF